MRWESGVRWVWLFAAVGGSAVSYRRGRAEKHR